MPDRATFYQLVEDLREAVRPDAILEDLPRTAIEAIARFMGVPEQGDAALELFFEHGRYVRRRGHVGPYGVKELTEIS